MIMTIGVIAFFLGYILGKRDSRTNNKNLARGYTPIYNDGCRNCINYMNMYVCKDCPLVEEDVLKVKPGTKV